MDKDDLIGQANSLMENKENTNLEEIIEKGLTDKQETLESLFKQLNDSLTEEMKQIVDLLNGISEDGKELKEYAIKAMGINKEQDGEESNSTDGGSDEIIYPKTGYTKVDDLSKIDQNYALGGLLIYYKLDDFQNAIMPFLERIGASKKENKGSDKENNFAFKNINSLDELSNSLKSFAKAISTLAKIPLKSSEAGVDFFIDTISKINDLAKIEAQNKDNLFNFIFSIRNINSLIKDYSKVCILLTLNLPFAAASIPALSLFDKFINKISDISKVAIENKDSIKDLYDTVESIGNSIASYSRICVLLTLCLPLSVTSLATLYIMGNFISKLNEISQDALENKENIKALSENIESIGESITSYSKICILLTLCLPLSIPSLLALHLMDNLISKLNEISQDAIKNKDNIKALSESINSFGDAITSYSKICILLTLCLPLSATSLLSLSFMESLIDGLNNIAQDALENKENIKALSESIESFGNAITSYSKICILLTLCLPLSATSIKALSYMLDFVDKLNEVSSRFVNGSEVNKNIKDLSDSMESLNTAISSYSRICVLLTLCLPLSNTSLKSLSFMLDFVDKLNEISEKYSNDNSKNLKALSESMGYFKDAITSYSKICILLSLCLPFALPSLATLLILEESLVEINEMSKDALANKENIKALSENLVYFNEAIKSYSFTCILLSICLPFAAISLATLLILEKSLESINNLSKDALANSKDIKALSTNMKNINKALVEYSKICILLSICLPFAATAQLTMLLFKGFIILVNGVAELLKDNIVNYVIMCIGLKELAKGFLLMGAAFLIMALVLPFIPLALLGILATIGVMTATAALGALAVSILPILLIFPACAIAMASGYIAMFLAIALLSMMKPDWENIDKSLEGIRTVMEQTGEMLGSIALALPAALLLSLVGTLLFAGFTTMSLAIFIAAFLGHFLGDGEWLKETLVSLQTNLFEVIGNGEFIGSVALGIAASILLVTFSVTFFTAMTLLMLSTLEVLAIKGLLDKIGDPKLVGKGLRDATTGIIYGLLGLEGDDVGVGDIVKASLAAAGLTAVTLLLIPFALSTALLFFAFNLTVLSIVSLKENLDKVGLEDIQKIMDSLGIVLKTLADSTEAFHDMSAKTIIAVGSLVKDVAEALDTLTNVVIKLKDGIPKEQIDIATESIKYICIKLFGDPDSTEDDGEYNLTKLFKTLADSKIKKLKEDAVAALVPIVDALDKLSDLVIKISNNRNFSLEKINAGSEAVQRVANLMAGVAVALHPLVKGTGLFGLAKSPLEALEEVNKSDFFGLVKNIMNQFGEASNLAMGIDSMGMSQFISFFNQDFEPFVKGSKSFEKGMDNLGDALGGLKNKDLDKLERLVNILSTDSSGLTQTVNSLSMFANNAPKFNSIANAFERISSSMETMSKKVGKLNGFFDNFANNSKNIEDTANNIDTNGNIPLDPAVQMIYDLINNWDTNGVPIRANVDKETGEIKPKDVGNETGRTSVRYR